MSDDKDKEKLGEAALFCGRLGEFYISDELRLSGLQLALYLISADAAVGSFWDTRTHRQQLHIVQHLNLNTGFPLMVELNWQAMHHEAQTQFHMRLQEVCARAADRMQRSTAELRQATADHLQTEKARAA